MRLLLVPFALLLAAGTPAREPVWPPDSEARAPARDLEAEWQLALQTRRALEPPGQRLDAAAVARLARAFRPRFEALAQAGSVRARAWLFTWRASSEDPDTLGPALVALAASAPATGLAPYGEAIASALEARRHEEGAGRLVPWVAAAADAGPSLEPRLRRAALRLRLAAPGADADDGLARELERLATQPGAGGDWARRALWRREHLAVGSEAPDFASSDPDGNEVRLSDLRGRVVAVLFWDPGSAPSAGPDAIGSADSPSSPGAPDEAGLALRAQVTSLAERYRDEDFLVVGVASGSDRAAYGRATRDLPFDWVHVFEPDAGPAAAAWHVAERPFLVLLDRQGRVLAADPPPSLLAGAVQRGLAQSTPAHEAAGF